MAASTISAASPPPAPSTRNTCSRWARPPINVHRPITPLVMIITVAYTVSRASVSIPAPPARRSARISVASITVMASASTSVPSGSPTRWAMTSAWWTAASTAATSASPERTISHGGSPLASAAARIAAAARGA